MSYLGIDVGTTKVKMTLVDDEGNLLGHVSKVVEPGTGVDGSVELDPNRWIEAIVELSRVIDLSDVEGIGLSGQMHTLILLDESGKPLRKAIIWSDPRGSEIVEKLPKRRILEECGSLPAVAFTLVKILYLMEREPETLDRANKFCSVKDFVGGWLTGNYDTELTDASATLMLDINEGEWNVRLLEELGVPTRILPDIHGSTEIRGYLKGDVAKTLGLKPGVPVVYGAGDQEAAALGCGVTEPNDVMMSLSTGAQIVVPVERPIIDPKIHNFRHIEGFHVMGAVQNAGLALNWAVRSFGFESPSNLSEMALRSVPGARGLVFLPYISPERTPIMSENVFGVLVGLKNHHGREDIARAVLEGVVFTVVDAWKYVKDLLELEPGEIISIGGVVESPVVREILEGSIGFPVTVLSGFDSSSYGAAVMVGGMGGYTKELREKFIVAKLEPRRSDYGTLFERFLDIRRKILGV